MIDLSASADREIALTARALVRIDAAARAAHLDYLVVGATARTILSIGLVGQPPGRSTRDVDIAVEVCSWEDFERLTGQLERHGRGVHKFLVDGVEVDVVPYGGIEREDRTILWPDDYRMNVRGLSEAAPTAETVVLPQGVTVRVPAVPALALLKLLTWRDRRNTTTRDADDLAEMISWYSSGAYFDRLYEEPEVLEKNEYDPALAGAWLLGSQMTALLDGEGRRVLLQIAEDEDTLRLLAADARAPRAPQPMLALGAGIRDAAGS